MTRLAFGGIRGGPVHRAQDSPGDDLSWCGVQAQFRHTPKPVEAVDCPRCIRRLALGRPLARGARS